MDLNCEPIGQQAATMHLADKLSAPWSFLTRESLFCTSIFALFIDIAAKCLPGLVIETMIRQCGVHCARFCFVFGPD